MSNILLINDNIKDFDKIIKACNKNTYSITYNQNTDTYDSIFVKYQSLLNDPSNIIQTIDHVALVSHGIPGETFSFLEKEEKMLLSKYIYNEKETTNSDNAEIPEPSFVDGSGISPSQQLIKGREGGREGGGVDWQQRLKRAPRLSPGPSIHVLRPPSSPLLPLIKSLNNLETWSSFKEFIQKFNIQKSLDFLGCALLQSTNWRYILSELETEQHLNLNIRASDDDTGNIKVGGDWVLESDNVNIKELYFDSELIEEYTGRFFWWISEVFSSITPTAVIGAAADIVGVAVKAIVNLQGLDDDLASALVQAVAVVGAHMVKNESDGNTLTVNLIHTLTVNLIHDKYYLGGARPWNIPTMKIAVYEDEDIWTHPSVGDIRYNNNNNKSAVQIYYGQDWKDLSSNETGYGRITFNKIDDGIKEKTFITHGDVLSGYDESELLIAGGGGWDGSGVSTKKTFSNYPSSPVSTISNNIVNISDDAFKAFNNNDNEFWLSSKNTTEDVSNVILGINFPSNTFYKITAFTIKEPNVSGGSFRFTSNDASFQNSPMHYSLQGLPFEASLNSLNSLNSDEQWNDLYIASEDTYAPVYSNGYATAVGIDGSGGIGGVGGIDVTRIPIDSAIVHDQSNNLDHEIMTNLKENREKIYKSVRLNITKGITDISFVTDSSGVTVGELLIYGTAYNYQGKGKLKIKGSDIDIVGNNNAVMALSHGGVPRLAIGRWSHIALPSDDRLKHNEEVIQNSLDLIEQLKPYKYQKTDKMYDAGYNGIIHDKWIWEIGLIAQDVSAIPYLNFMVKQMPNDGMYTLSYFNLIGLLVQGAKDLYNENKSLKKDIATCKNDTQDLSGSLNVTIDELNNKVEELESLVLALEN